MFLFVLTVLLQKTKQLVPKFQSGNELLEMGIRIISDYLLSPYVEIE